MYQINDKCIGCAVCKRDCPVGAISILNKKAQISESCVACGICRRVCPSDAVAEQMPTASAQICRSCPVQCAIPEGMTGACKRYTNNGGRLERNRAPVFDNGKDQNLPDSRITRPVMTAVGSGTNYPCSLPAPFIVSECRDGVDVVTVVTEAPLSYSEVILKLDTNSHIGEEGDTVYRQGVPVGLVNTEEYGSKMISIGGANKLTGNSGFIVARTITELANGDEVSLTIGKPAVARLKVQHGRAPRINGVTETLMRIGCGSATVGLFAAKMKESVDECIVIDHHVTGLLSEHMAGEAVGMRWSGISVNARKSSRGRYFGEHGNGIGGTKFASPADAIGPIDMKTARPGMTLLVTNTTGEVASLFKLSAEGTAEEVPMTPKADSVVQSIRDNCEESKTSVIYSGGTGGSARGGVCKAPLLLTKAVHNGKASLSIGGAPAFVMPGGGINFLVDTDKVVSRAFTWVPTPATVAPVEYTMTVEDYAAMAGHSEEIRPVLEVREEYSSKKGHRK